VKSTYLVAIFILSQYASSGQLRYYQHAVQSQVYENVGNTGANGTSTIRTSYQRSSASSAKQGMLYYDKGILLTNNDLLGYGVGAAFDQAGESDFRNASIGLMGAYHRVLNANENYSQHLSFGGSMMLHNRSLNTEGLRWPSQISPSTGFDPTKDPGSSASGDFSTHYLAFDIGLTYAYYYKRNQYMKLGVALHDFNQPNMSFYQYSDVPLMPSWVFSALGQFQVYKALYLEPSIRYFSSSYVSLFSVSNNFKYQLNNHSSILLGMGYFDNGSIFGTVGAELGRWRAMVTYGSSTDKVFKYKLLELGVAITLDRGLASVAK